MSLSDSHLERKDASAVQPAALDLPLSPMGSLPTSAGSLQAPSPRRHSLKRAASIFNQCPSPSPSPSLSLSHHHLTPSPAHRSSSIFSSPPAPARSDSFSVNLSVIVPPLSSHPLSSPSPSPKPLVATPTFRILPKHEYPAIQSTSPSPAALDRQLSTLSTAALSPANQASVSDAPARVTSRGRTVKPPPDREITPLTSGRRKLSAQSPVESKESASQSPLALAPAELDELDDLRMYHEQIWTLWQLRADYLIGENKRKLKKNIHRPSIPHTPKHRGSALHSFPSPEFGRASSPSPAPSPLVNSLSTPVHSRNRSPSPPPLSACISSPPSVNRSSSACSGSPLPSPSSLVPLSSPSPSPSSHSLFAPPLLPHAPNARIAGYKEFYIPPHPSQLTFHLIDDLSILLTMPVPPSQEDMPAFKLLSSMLLLPLPPPLDELPPLVKPRFNYDWMDSSKKQWKQPNHLIQCVSDKDSEHANALNNNHFKFAEESTPNESAGKKAHQHSEKEKEQNETNKKPKLHAASAAKHQPQPSKPSTHKKSTPNVPCSPLPGVSPSFKLHLKVLRSSDSKTIDAVAVLPAPASMAELQKEIKSLEAAIRKEKEELKALRKKSKRAANAMSGSEDQNKCKTPNKKVKKEKMTPNSLEASEPTPMTIEEPVRDPIDSISDPPAVDESPTPSSPSVHSRTGDSIITAVATAASVVSSPSGAADSRASIDSHSLSSSSAVPSPPHTLWPTTIASIGETASIISEPLHHASSAMLLRSESAASNHSALSSPTSVIHDRLLSSPLPQQIPIAIPLATQSSAPSIIGSVSVAASSITATSEVATSDSE